MSFNYEGNGQTSSNTTGLKEITFSDSSWKIFPVVKCS